MITVGSQVRGYTVVRLLGQGGMGKVYLAQHQRIARHVAVKVLLPELSSNQEVIERFFTEAQATSLIHHPGIVEVLDCDVLDDQAFIVMEYLHGESLATYWARLGGKMNDIPFALAILAQVADAVGAAHGAGIIHRDLKPDNVFLCAGPRDSRVTPKVLDFGIAKVAVQGSTSHTRTGVVIGTPTYMSPEQCRESKMVDGRADIYSLGCIFYEALCGRPPFVRDGFGAMIVAHVSEEPDDPRGLVPDLPPDVVALLARMLAKDRDERPETMGAVASELRRLLDAMGVRAPFGEVLPRQPVVRPNIEIDARLRTPIPPILKTPSAPGPFAGSSPGAASDATPAPIFAAGASLPGARVSVPTRSTLSGAAGERSDAENATLRQRASSRRWVIPAALVVVGGLAFAAKSLLSRPEVATASSSGAEIEKPAATPEAPPVAPAPPAPEIVSVTVDVRGLPVGAEVWLDGAKAPGLPLKMSRDERRHRLLVRATGHVERVLEIGADRDQTIDIDLPAIARAKTAKHRVPPAPPAARDKPALDKPAAAVTSPPRNNDTTPAKKVPDNHGRRSNYDDM